MAGETYALIMAGGGGTRLWPASRKRRPKQFLPLLDGGETLLAATVGRLEGLLPPERVLVVTAADQVAEVRRTAPGVPPENIVVEPEACNTAPCIGLGALEVLRRDPAGLLAVLPSDQWVRDAAAFRATLGQAIAVAQAGAIVTVGIVPTAPETGFGYLEVGAASAQGARVVERFVEKPDHATATRYVASGRYLWNSGMFFFSARRLLEALGVHLPELAALLRRIAAAPAEVGALYPEAPKVSIDYGLMEKLPRGEVFVVPGQFGWNDVGSWSALGTLLPADPEGNALAGDSLTITVDAAGNVIYGEGRRAIAAVGVDNLIIVAVGDAVLVMSKTRAQEVRDVVKRLESSHRKEYL